jgi:hypothetical protein
MSESKQPADQGLSSLGLLMQLAGSVFAAAAGIFVLGTVVESRHGPSSHDILWKLAMLVPAIARSLLHRQAGTVLLYGVPGTDNAKHRLRGVYLYIGGGIAHSIFVAIMLGAYVHAPMKAAVAVGAGLAVWPVFLAALLALPRFRRLRGELPVTEDKGFEGASILMTIFGVSGVLSAGIVLVTYIDDERALSRGPGVLIALALVMLVVRSSLHAQAGISGLRETSMERSVELVNRYANFGVISSFCGGGALLLFFVTQHASIVGLAIICGLCWMLVAWPLTIRRFVADRQFADLMAGDDAPVHHRAKDAGLTSLGWLLVGHAMVEATLLVPQLIGGPSMLAVSVTNIGMRSIWFPIALAVMQAWAGFELVRMSPQSRGIATLYGVVAVTTTIYISYPALELVQRASGLQSRTDAIAIGAVMFALVLPIATLVLVHRTVTPTARARFRR